MLLRRTTLLAVAALSVVLFLLATGPSAVAADDINAQWDDLLSTLSDLRSACQPLVATPTPASSSAASPAASRSATPAASRAASPASSRSATPAASRSATPAASRSSTPSASRSATPAASRSASPAASRSASPSAISVTTPSASPSGGLLMSVTVGPGQKYTEPADAIPFMAPGFTMTVLPGTYLKPFDIPPTLGGWTINGAGGGQTIFDGRGGIGGGHRLSFGKGFVHTRCPGTLTNIVFTRGGGGDGKADGEAGVYAESFTSPGTLRIDRCLFSFNENGIFVPPTGAGNPGNGIAVVVTNSDFHDNGQTPDGGSHDLYVQGDSYTETNCHHYGSTHGNNIKCRSPVLSVTGGYHANRVGSRWIDYPNGGTATINGGIFVIPSSSAGGNVLSYAIENENNGVTGGMSFSNSQLYIGRSGTQMYVRAGGRISFDSSVSLTWLSSGANINVLGTGQMTGIATSPSGSTIGSEPAIPANVSGN